MWKGCRTLLVLYTVHSSTLPRATVWRSARLDWNGMYSPGNAGFVDASVLAAPTVYTPSAMNVAPVWNTQSFNSAPGWTRLLAGGAVIGGRGASSGSGLKMAAKTI